MTERPILMSAPMVRAILEGRKTQTRRVVKPQPPEETPYFRGCIGSYSGAIRPYFFWGRYESRDANIAYLEQPDHDLDLEEDILWPGGDSDGFTCDMFGAESGLLCPFGAAANPFRKHGDRLWVRETFRFTDVFDQDSPSRVGERCVDAGYRTPWAPLQFEADGRRMNWEHTGTPPHDGRPMPGKLRPAIHMPRWASRILLDITAVRVERLQDISDADARAEGVGWSDYQDQHGERMEPREAFAALWEQINGPGSWEANPWVWVIDFRRIEP